MPAGWRAEVEMQKLDKIEATLPAVTVRRAKGPEDEEGKNVAGLNVVIKTVMRVTGETFPPFFSWAFPGIDAMAREIAGNDDHPGIVLKSKMKLGDVKLVITRPDGAVVCEVDRVAASTVTLNLDSGGDGRATLSFTGKVGRDQKRMLDDHAGDADVLVSIWRTQEELPLAGVTEIATRNRKKSAEAE
jgi:hypothetical protein